MKLLTRTNAYYITFSIIAYIALTGVFYVVTEYVIYQEVEARLKVERQDFENYVAEQGVWEASCYFVEDKIALKAVQDTLAPIEVFKDTLFANRYDEEIMPFRQYSFYKVINEQPYKVSIRKSLIESNTLLTFITLTMVVLLGIGMFVLFLLQKKVSKKIWQPFYQSLTEAKSFDIRHGVGLKMKEEPIYEFQELNEVLEKMTHKIAGDYQNLKEFTENAAHEIQTPLALINSRIEELIQGENFTDQQMYWVEEIHTSSLRLSKLHYGLLLLSKIENGQFYEHEAVNITQLAKGKFLDYQEVFEYKELETRFVESGDFMVEMNPALADILITNLLNNAVRHNIIRGSLQVEVHSQRLVLSNTGESIQFSPEKLFERFKKQHQSSASLGLGLAIVKKICTYYNFDIEYEVIDNLHTISIVNTK
uniref:histidine kinase n=1 Tax=Roseihalotalea indica TaxID=2867963 RepID=A0AA49GU67_9BACT|nr:HAMP domain-containing sensor histidine kinase [Tunicatimonas sp. TK19036]